MTKEDWPHCDLHDRNIVERFPPKCALADFGVLLRMKVAADKACAASQHGAARYLQLRYGTCFKCETDLPSHWYIRFLRSRANEERHAEQALRRGRIGTGKARRSEGSQ